MDKNIISEIIGAKMDDFEFRPVTKGLGFHQERRNERPTITSVEGIRKSSHIRPNTTHGHASNLTQTQALRSSPTTKLEQQPFSSTRVVENVGPKEVLAAKGMQFLAWSIDVSIVCLLTWITFEIFAWLTGSRLLFFRVMGHDLVIAALACAVFAVYYLAFFTVMDLAGTPGKMIMRLRLVKNGNGPITTRHTLLRSFLTLISFFALGLPMYMDFQGKLSDSRLIR